MNGLDVLLELILVTLFSAGLGNLLVPFAALGAAHRRHAEGVGTVAVLAIGFGVRRIVFVGRGVEGILIRFDILHHQAEPGFLFGQIFLFDGFPQCLVTGNTVGLSHGRIDLVRRDSVGDLLVACDALHVAMDTFVVLDLIHRRERPLLTLFGCNFKYALAAVVTFEAGDSVKFARFGSGLRLPD